MTDPALLQFDVIGSVGPQLVAFAVGVLAGALAPTYYAAERLRGLGRWMLAKAPYQPPPGQREEEAMEQAAQEADSSENTK